jgi:hydrogenase-4 membrane subunit HyfE
VTGLLAWVLLLLGVGVVVVRRRSVAVALVTAQALVLAATALAEADAPADVGAAATLALRGLVLGGVLLLVVSRTREPRPVRAGTAPFVRGTVAVSLALALIWLVPTIGLETREAERAVLALAAFGVTAAALRRATLFQILGIVLVENALAFAALRLPHGSSLVIETGVALDLILVTLVAAVFHERIFAELGAGDTALLRSLRD